MYEYFLYYTLNDADIIFLGPVMVIWMTNSPRQNHTSWRLVSTQLLTRSKYTGWMNCAACESRVFACHGGREAGHWHAKSEPESPRSGLFDSLS